MNAIPSLPDPSPVWMKNLLSDFTRVLSNQAAPVGSRVDLGDPRAGRDGKRPQIEGTRSAILADQQPAPPGRPHASQVRAGPEGGPRLGRRGREVVELYRQPRFGGR